MHPGCGNPGLRSAGDELVSGAGGHEADPRRLHEEKDQGTVAGTGLFESLDVASTIVVVMGPATMLSHRLEIEKRVEGTVRAPGEESQVVTQVDEQVTTFTYLD